ncbi:MAG: hypothetical protein QE276_03435 [Cyanobium sp. D14.bin.5]|nr:hypothetical protein [Cyanobium sp. D14.bin.5]
MSVDKNCCHRGSDARDSPLLGEGEDVAEEVDVVIGGEQGDQGLEDPWRIEAQPAELRWW